MLRPLIAPVAVVVLAALASGCSNRDPAFVEAEDAPGARTPEAVSLLGAPLYPMPLPAAVEQQRRLDWEVARETWIDHPDDLDAVIWYGRRTAYLGNYREAIAIYTQGLGRFPDSPRLLRHRGHRWITVRRFDEARADLERAAALVEGAPDALEPDGLPNERGIPTSTTQSNIFYHLGLAHYVQARWDDAVDAYRRCELVSTTDDMRVATWYWLHLALRRAGRNAEAAVVLEPVTPDLDVIENHAYLELLLLYRGDLTIEDVLGGAEGDDVRIDDATRGYGVAMQHRFTGDRAAWLEALRAVVAGDAWPAFGSIAAEADLARER